VCGKRVKVYFFTQGATEQRETIFAGSDLTANS